MALGTTTAVLGTASIVALGKWADDSPIDIKYVVGTGIMAASLSILGEINPKLGAQFGVLVFITAILIWGPKAMIALGMRQAGGQLQGLGTAIGDAARAAAGK